MKTKKKVVKKAVKKVAKKTLKQIIAQDKKSLAEFCTGKCFKSIHTIEEQLSELFSNKRMQDMIKTHVLDGIMARGTETGSVEVLLIFNNDETLLKAVEGKGIDPKIKKKIDDFLDYLESKMKR